MAASTLVHNFIVAVVALAPSIVDGPAGNVFGDEEVTDDDLQIALTLTDVVIQMRAGTNPFVSDPELVELLNSTNFYEGTGDVVLKVSLTQLKMLSLIPEAQRVA